MDKAGRIECFSLLARGILDAGASREKRAQKDGGKRLITSRGDCVLNTPRKQIDKNYLSDVVGGETFRLDGFRSGRHVLRNEMFNLFLDIYLVHLIGQP